MSEIQTEGRIRALSRVLVDKIAAGEVIEGPASVIKELIENSIDAGSDSIRIETKAAGTEQITVEDNGLGIYQEDLSASIVRHATSKISTFEDLEKLSSLGFRGEALAAIAAIAHLQLKSRRQGQKTGGQIICRGGEIISESTVNHAQGSTIQVSSLFYSTPARRKYLKSARAENAKNHKELIRLALAKPHIHFAYYREAKPFADYPGGQSLNERIAAVYDKHLTTHLVEVKNEYGGIKLSGYVSTPEYFRANRDGQYTFVNQRASDIKNMSFLVRKAYEELLAPGMHPYFFLFLELDPGRLDVNVHPQKREVRLLDEQLLHSLLSQAIKQALRPHAPISLNQVQHRRGLDAGTSRDHSKAKVAAGNTPAFPALALGRQGGVQLSPGYVLDMGRRAAFSVEKEHEAHGPSKLAYTSEKTEIGSKPEAEAGSEHPVEQKARAQAKEALSDSPSPSAFALHRHFGTILGTYVLAEGNGYLYIIDQHTAHERVNYEQTLDKLEALGNQRQGLLEPMLINCLPDEAENILAHTAELQKSGFLVEAAGPRAYTVREVPPYIDPGAEMDVLVHLIHRVLEGDHGLHLYKDYAAMRACKASIKKNDHISDELLAEILRALPLCKEPGRCPHGRPTMIQVSRNELDRMFQR